METLIIGIDGGDLEILNSFDMPFFKELLKNNKYKTLEEDLFDRGWVKILTGEPAVNTKAFYMYPEFGNDEVKFTTSFKMADLALEKDIKPLWDLLDEAGTSYCFMNIPTTTPVPDINSGVVIGSAGGGLNSIDGVPECLVSDEAIRETLIKNNYKVDIRIPNDEIELTKDLFEELLVMEAERTRLFIEVSKNKDSKVGFLVDRGTTIVQYLARNVIQRCKIDGGNIREDELWALECLNKYYTQLDENLRKLFEELKPTSFIITADHNTAPYKFKASVSPFLEEIGYLKKPINKKYLPYLKSLVRRIGGSKLTRKIKNSIPLANTMDFSGYDRKKSLAFGSTYVSGIYINDERFFSIVKGEAHRDEVLADIINKFNLQPENVRNGMYAESYRKEKGGRKYSDYLPDIIIKNSEGVHFFEKLPNISQANVEYEKSISEKVSDIKYAAHSGDKGLNPICIYSEDLDEYFKGDVDLTAVYGVIKAVYGVKK